MKVANKTGPKNSHIRNFLLPVLIIIVYLPCISLNITEGGNPPFVVAGIFMPVYDLSIWRFRTPV